MAIFGHPRCDTSVALADRGLGKLPDHPAGLMPYTSAAQRPQKKGRHKNSVDATSHIAETLTISRQSVTNQGVAPTACKEESLLGFVRGSDKQRTTRKVWRSRSQLGTEALGKAFM